MIIVGYVVCIWFMIGSIVIWYLLCHSRMKNEYLDRINDTVDIFTVNGVNHRLAQYFMMLASVIMWPIVASMIVLEMIGRGRSDRDDY
jgi:hypothetical protein